MGIKLKFRVISPDMCVLFSKEDEKDELPIRLIVNEAKVQKEERGRLIL